MSAPDVHTARLGEPSVQRELPPTFLVGWTRYDVLHRIGAGGMGEVFKAWDPQLGRHVALKFLHATDAETLERFAREARAQARVDHPGICKVFEVGSVGGHPYIAMQEIEGVTLDEAAKRLSIEQKVRLVREVCEAVQAAHRQGLIHRDLKPGNILVEQTDDGLRPYVVDFGLARDQESPSGYTISGAIAGTIGYLSPEQARGKPEHIDRRTDVYSLGVVLYELLTGRVPFESRDLFSSLVRLQDEDAPSPRKVQAAIPRDLETIVLKCLERDSSRRYDSARALMDDLDRFLDGEPILARRANVLYRLRKRLAKHRAIASVAFVAFLLLTGMGAAALRTRWQADRRAELAHQFGQQVKEMELLTRVANMLPPERATPPRELLAPRMNRIREEMTKVGDDARGPGYYALARGHLALGDLSEARRDIDLATSAGYDTADVRFTRGEVEGRLYQEALVKASHLTDRDLREEAIRSARATHRAAALRHLRAASGASVAHPELLAAQIALFDDRFDDALKAARRAAAAVPWMYEARLLEAMVLRTRANQLGRSGAVEESLRLLDESGLAMNAALQIGRSDSMALVEECSRRAIRLRNLQFLRRASEAEIAEAAAPCRVAITVDASNARAWLTIARIENSVSEDRARNGEDPAAAVVSAIDAAAHAAALDPQLAEAHHARGSAAINSARWTYNHGGDPTRELTMATQSLQRAVALNGRSADFRNTLANAHVLRAFYAARIGADPTPHARDAIEHYQRALEIVPSYAIAYSNIGTAYVQLADHALKHGGDAVTPLDRAIVHLTRAVSLMPTNVSAHNNTGNAHSSRAEIALKMGNDPTPHAERAIASFRKASELRPDYPIAYYNLAYATRLIAQYRVDKGQDPTAQLRVALPSLDRYDEVAPNDPDSIILRARYALIEARHSANMGDDPSESVARGLALLHRTRNVADAEEIGRDLRAVKRPLTRPSATLSPLTRGEGM